MSLGRTEMWEDTLHVSEGSQVQLCLGLRRHSSSEGERNKGLIYTTAAAGFSEEGNLVLMVCTAKAKA